MPVGGGATTPTHARPHTHARTLTPTQRTRTCTCSRTYTCARTPTRIAARYFHWYVRKDDPCLWEELREKALALKEVGIDALWVPPAYKGSSGDNDVGYGTYDLFDLGMGDFGYLSRWMYACPCRMFECHGACDLL